MGEIFSYSIEGGIILILLYIAYKLTMAGERQFAANRATIHSIYAGALILPWAYPAIGQILKGNGTPGVSNIDIGMLGAFIGDTPADESTPIWPKVLLWIYLTGIVLTSARLIASIIRIVRIANSRERQTLYTGHILVLTDEREFSPFSFMRYIVISREDYEKSRNEILTHELTHLRQRHWVDQLIANVAAIFMWYNPAAWLMIEELKSVHEYQADAAVIDSGADIRSYQYLLIEKAVGKRFPSPANSLNHSKLKKRVTMMYKSKPTAMRRMAGIALIPAAAAALAIINLPAVAGVVSETGSASLRSVSDGKVNNNSAVEQTAGDKTAGKGEQKVESAGTLNKLDPLMVVAYRNPESVTTTKYEEPLNIIEKEKDGNPRLYVDGKEVSYDKLKEIDPEQIESIDVDKSNGTKEIRVHMKSGDSGKSAAAGNSSDKKAYDTPEVLPEFPGGLSAMMQWLANNIRYPKEAHDQDIEGKVVVRFVVTKEGKVTDPSIVKSVAPSLDAEALRVVGEMPDWTPGKNDGAAVDCGFALPINFKLQTPKKLEKE